MKIYVQNHGWAGALVVVAASEEEARAMMKEMVTYMKSQPLEVFEIKPGVVVDNYGGY